MEFPKGITAKETLKNSFNHEWTRMNTNGNKAGAIGSGGHGSKGDRSAPVPGRRNVKRAAISENNGAGR